MKKKLLIHGTLIVLLLAGIGAGWALISYYENLPKRLSQNETILLGQNRFNPASQAAVRVVVRDSKDGAGLANADVEVLMQPKSGGKAVPLYSGKTGASGSADVSFKIPATIERDQTLIVRTKSSLGSSEITREVTVERDYRVLLTTDKPIYQPGQVIHMRALALSTFDLVAAMKMPLELVIADGKGNKVFRQTVTTSEYGTASADFQLASEVNNGNYKITATLGNTSSEKTVTVQPYMLPKFDVKLKTEKAFYQPGEHVKGSLNASYFFGKPVSGGKVTLEGFTYDVARNQVLKIEGTTGEDGSYAFEFDLPPYLAGSELEKGMALFYVETSVVDQAAHTEGANLSIPVSASGLVIQAVPEGGTLRPGLENILYVMASYPDGSPAEAKLNISFENPNQTINVETGPYGLAEARFTPSQPYASVFIQASDKAGALGTASFNFQGEYSAESLLLRPEKPVYKVGETMKLDLFSTKSTGTVYLDLVREGQTASTRTVEIKDGRGEAAIDLTGDLAGELELHAYDISAEGQISRDTRLVVVTQAEDLKLTLKPEADLYHPGEDGKVDLTVSGTDGQGVKSAVGLAIVDESVFALAESDPGFAKLYFMLENELLIPRYDLHGYSLANLVRNDLPTDDPKLEGAVQEAAQASLSDALKGKNIQAAVFSLNASSRTDALKRSSGMQQNFFSTFTKVMYAIFIALPLILAGLTVYALRKDKRLGKSLHYTLTGALVVALFLLVVPPPSDYNWSDPSQQNTLERLGTWMRWLFTNEGSIAVIGLMSLAGAIALIVIAIRKKDALLGWSLALPPLAAAALVLLAIADSYATFLSPGVMAYALVAAMLLVPLSFWLRSAGYFARREWISAVATLGASLLFLPALLVMAFAAPLVVNGSVVHGDAMDARNLMAEPLPADQALDKGFVELRQQGAQMPPAAMPTQTAAGGKAINPQQPAGQGAEPPRLRQHFPETMLWLPDAVTDENGHLVVDVPVADNITTWRMTALASSQDGRLGSASEPLKVFQDFFIDLDLPLSLTVGDEVSIPVGIYNYLPEAQTVRLELEQAGWFDLVGKPTQEVTIAANDISVAYFTIRAKAFGSQPFKVTAWGSKMSDAILKQVQVYPDGKELRFTQSDRLEAGKPVKLPVTLPTQAIPGTQRLAVKIYPGIFSQVVEGLDSILRMPSGCFEQTSSSTYPNVLVMDYLKTTNQASPEVQMKAEEYINLGYQRLTTFEVATSGGFSLFGNEPADRMLTAYGLQEFADMSRVHAVDADLMKRAATWLFSQQAADGSWENDRGLVHESTWSGLGNDRLPVTAYITWSLIDAGFIDDSHTTRGLEYIREHQAEAKDAYVLGLAANALVSADLKAGEISPATAGVLDRLAAAAKRDGEAAYWQSSIATFMGSKGETGSIETTALAALALLRAQSHTDVANAALVYLIRQKDSYGTWYSTQATVLALKALLQSVRGSGENVNATVTVKLNGGQEKTLQVTPQNFDVVQVVTFDDVNPGAENTLEISAEGKGNLMYQVAGSYYVPWKQLDELPNAGAAEAVKIDVAYDRAELAVNDTVNVNVSVALLEPGASADSALIDLGIPPGFSVQTEDLDAIVAHYRGAAAGSDAVSIERYELTGRQVLVYVRNLKAGQPLQFTFRMKARFPVKVKSPVSSVYDYYNPDQSGENQPQEISVKP